MAILHCLGHGHPLRLLSTGEASDQFLGAAGSAGTPVIRGTKYAFNATCFGGFAIMLASNVAVRYASARTARQKLGGIVKR